MKIIIYTAFDCLVKLKDDEQTLSANEHLIIDEKPDSILIYPQNGRKISFEVDFSKAQSPFYRIIEKDDKLLVFLLDGVVAQNVKLFDIRCGDKKCHIEIGRHDLSFSSGENKKVLSLNHDIYSSTCGSFFHIAYAKISHAGGETLVAYNTKTNIAKVFNGDKIAINDDGFSVSTKADGYTKIQEEYFVTKQGLKLKNKDFQVLQASYPQELVSLRFLNCVKVGDYASAFEMLSPKLQENLNIDSLKGYFGNISYIFPLDQESCFAMSGDEGKIYNFCCSGDKIIEIDD